MTGQPAVHLSSINGAAEVWTPLPQQALSPPCDLLNDLSACRFPVGIQGEGQFFLTLLSHCPSVSWSHCGTPQMAFTWRREETWFMNDHLGLPPK